MRFPKMSERAALILIFISNLALRLIRINIPPEAYFDEKLFYLPAARSIINGQGDPNYMHPPLAKELIALAIHFFGDNSFAWRSLQAVLASLAVVAVYFLAKKMFGGRVVPTIASFLLTVDFSWFTLSRIAIPEMFMISFFIFSLYFLYSFYLGKKQINLVLGSIFFGLALACKWTPLIFLLVLVFVLLKIFRATLQKKIITTIIFVVFTSSVYLGAFLFLPNNFSINKLITTQTKMLDYHLNKEVKQRSLPGVKVTLPDNAIFWPVYLYNFYGENDQGLVKTIVFFFNPILLWGSLIVSVLTVRDLLKRKKVTRELFLVTSFLLFWFVWVFSPRDSYPYYWAIGMPFGAILLAKFLAEKSKRYFWEVAGILVASLVVFIFYYPLLTFWGVKVWYLQILTGASGLN